MGKQILYLIIGILRFGLASAIVLAIDVIVCPLEVKAAGIEEPMRVEMTCYHYTGNLCRNGKEPREGTCAYLKEYFGDYLIVAYEDDNGQPGELIGYFEVYDTGYGRPTEHLKEDGTPYGTLELGMSIDIYRDTLDRCYEFIAEHGDHCFIQIIEAEG